MLTSGTRLGHIEVLELLGVGGCGEVTADGQRFLINARPADSQPASDEISVVLNWAEALRK